MVHLCTDFPGHTKYWHRCNCGKAWPTTPTEDDTMTTTTNHTTAALAAGIVASLAGA